MVGYFFIKGNKAMALLKGIFLLFASVGLSSADGIPESIGAFSDICKPKTSCRTNFQGHAKDFGFHWRSYKEGRRHYLEVRMEGDIFQVPIAPWHITDYPFPLELYIFSPSLKLYGLLSNNGSAGIFVNYFSRDGEGFHYLGVFPILTYDKNSGHFIGGEFISSSEHLVSYYKLENNALVLDRTENTLDEDALKNK